MRSALVASAIAAAAVVTAAVACTTTDPRAGTGSRRTSSSSSASSSSSSGGLDGAVPDAPLDCGAAPGADAPFSKTALLDAAGKCAAWHACNFQNAAIALRTSLHDRIATPNDETIASSRSAWKAAMNEWSKMELFQFGPVASKIADKYYGRGLRTFVHPWPDLNRCQVETQIATKAYEQGWDVVFPSGRGLYALEYALFHSGTDTVCLPNSTAAKTWATLSPEQIVTSTMHYGSAVADNVVAIALELRNVWLPEGENFGAKLASFDGYGSEQETLNVVAWSLFYPEKEIKDLKLGVLAGLQTGAPTPETPFALVEIENVRTNLRAWRALFQGCSSDGTGVGFDDWLIAAGHHELAADMLAALERAQTAADAFPSFSAATQAQFVELCDAIKPLSDLLKTSFFGSASPLNLKLPASAASDTD